MDADAYTALSLGPAGVDAYPGDTIVRVSLCHPHQSLRSKVSTQLIVIPRHVLWKGTLVPLQWVGICYRV